MVAACPERSRRNRRAFSSEVAPKKLNCRNHFLRTFSLDAASKSNNEEIYPLSASRFVHFFCFGHRQPCRPVQPDGEQFSRLLGSRTHAASARRLLLRSSSGLLLRLRSLSLWPLSLRSFLLRRPKYLLWLWFRPWRVSPSSLKHDSRRSSDDGGRGA